MNHKKRIIPAILLVLVQMLVYAVQDSEKYNYSLKKWREEGISRYNIKVSYNAFSPLSGIWDIEVIDGKPVSVKFKGKSGQQYLKTAGRFTMESLYVIAENSLTTQADAPMKTETEYDSVTGFIKSVSRISNPSFRGGVKMDAGYSIRVLEFHPLK
jgi:hypothetical protein